MVEEEEGVAHMSALALSGRRNPFLRGFIFILVFGHRPERTPPPIMGRPERPEDVWTEGGRRLEHRGSDVLQLRIGRGVRKQTPISIQ